MTGSHNIVCGYWNSFSSFGGLVAGSGNTVRDVCASVPGGSDNGATDATQALRRLQEHGGGARDGVSGGWANIASALLRA